MWYEAFIQKHQHPKVIVTSIGELLKLPQFNISIAAGNCSNTTSNRQHTSHKIRGLAYIFQASGSNFEEVSSDSYSWKNIYNMAKFLKIDNIRPWSCLERIWGGNPFNSTCRTPRVPDKISPRNGQCVTTMNLME